MLWRSVAVALQSVSKEPSSKAGRDEIGRHLLPKAAIANLHSSLATADRCVEPRIFTEKSCARRIDLNQVLPSNAA
jgi:hypothetical protein